MTRDRIYASLLRLYPKSFRDQYESSIMHTFSEFSRDHRGTPLHFWSVIARDVWRSLWREHLDAWLGGRRREALRWVSACVAGAILSAALIVGLIAAVNVLMPPRIELVPLSDGTIGKVAHWYGQNLPVGVYGALVGLALGASQAVALRGRIRKPWVWVLGTCVCGALGIPFGFVVAKLVGVQKLVGLDVSGYWIGVLMLGAFVGMTQAFAVRASRSGALRLMLWNALSIAAGIACGAMAGGIAVALTGATRIRTPLEFFALSAVVAAVAGLAIGLVSVGPLTNALSRQRDAVVD